MLLVPLPLYDAVGAECGPNDCVASGVLLEVTPALTSPSYRPCSIMAGIMGASIMEVGA